MHGWRIGLTAAVLVSLVFGSGRDSGQEDVIITITSPSTSKIYEVSTLRADISIEFKVGPVSESVRKSSSSFALCLSWDSLNQSSNFICQSLLRNSMPVIPANMSSGVHCFEVSLHRTNNVVDWTSSEEILIGSSTLLSMMGPPLFQERVLYFLDKAELSSDAVDEGVEERPINTPMTVEVLEPVFPCAYAGTFTAIAPWSVAFSNGPTPPLALAGPRVDIPIALDGVSAWSVVDDALSSQFRVICDGHFPTINHPSNIDIATGVGGRVMDPGIRNQRDNLVYQDADVVGWDPER
jgi:hypothetical protein